MKMEAAYMVERSGRVDCAESHIWRSVHVPVHIMYRPARTQCGQQLCKSVRHRPSRACSTLREFTSRALAREGRAACSQPRETCTAHAAASCRMTRTFPRDEREGGEVYVWRMISRVNNDAPAARSYTNHPDGLQPIALSPLMHQNSAEQIMCPGTGCCPDEGSLREGGGRALRSKCVGVMDVDTEEGLFGCAWLIPLTFSRAVSLFPPFPLGP
ncbi:hypothetical protein B0H11DRAFT_1941986 [Mycena galericulata]|nr:hypothetical protein B0H11DRAFT_1941986 [Mycena galericulata]